MNCRLQNMMPKSAWEEEGQKSSVDYKFQTTSNESKSKRVLEGTVSVLGVG